MIHRNDRLRCLLCLTVVAFVLGANAPADAKTVRLKPVRVQPAHNDAPKWKPAYVSSSGKLIPGHFVARHPKF
jgi:hypothetical protein